MRVGWIWGGGPDLSLLGGVLPGPAVLPGKRRGPLPDMPPECQAALGKAPDSEHEESCLGRTIRGMTGSQLRSSRRTSAARMSANFFRMCPAKTDGLLNATETSA